MAPGHALPAIESTSTAIDPATVTLELIGSGQGSGLEIHLSSSTSVSAIVLVTLADGSVHQLYPEEPGQIVPLPEGRNVIAVPEVSRKHLYQGRARVVAYTTVEPVELPFIVGARPEVGHIVYPRWLLDFGQRKPAEELSDWLREQALTRRDWTRIEARWPTSPSTFSSR